MSAPHRKCCHLPVRGARKRAINGSPLAFRRSTAALAKALTPWLSFGPRFLELPGANGRTLPGASAASTSRTGRSAGRSMPEAARVRGYEPRPREPLSLRRRYVTGDALDERDWLTVAETGTHVKRYVTTLATPVTRNLAAPLRKRHTSRRFGSSKPRLIIRVRLACPAARFSHHW